MGMSSDGLLFFGFSIPEGFTLPWDDEVEERGFRDGDIESWWLEKNNFKSNIKINFYLLI